MKSIKRAFGQPELHALMLLFCFALFNWPFLNIFGSGQVRALAVYLLTVWLISIALLLVIGISCSKESEERDKTERSVDD